MTQFTSSTASITLTWSASSGADNYTIVVTPPLPSGQSLLSTTTTSQQLQQLTVLYNEKYSINITAHNCAGSSTTGEPLIVGKYTAVIYCELAFPHFPSGLPFATSTCSW